MANRAVRFQIHIRPLFSAMDRDHMLFFADLWDTATFYASDGRPKDDIIKKIYGHIAPPNGGMPPVTHGGPWPDEWQNLYKRWMNEGCKKLDLGKGTYTASRLPGNTVLLSAQDVKVPEGSELWLERDNGCPADFVFNLFIEPPVDGTGKTKIGSATEEVKNVPTDVTTFTIVASDGRQKVAIG